MYGGMQSVFWAVTYVKDKRTYYLSECDDFLRKLVWTSRHEKAKKFVSQASAEECIKSIKESRDNKKLGLKTQVL